MNRVALITGSTSGIGLGIAKHFAKEGYDIMFHGLENNGGEIAQSVAKEYNVKTSFSNANMLEAEAIENLVKQTIETFGGLHILINNAGITKDNLAVVLSEKKWDEIIKINLNFIKY